jgi:hypothetical protein
MSVSTKERVGRDGFRGSPITVWCSGCEDYVVQMSNGECGWCEKQLAKLRAETPRKTRSANSAEIDTEIRKWQKRGMGTRAIGKMVGLDERSVRRRVSAMAGAA